MRTRASGSSQRCDHSSARRRNRYHIRTGVTGHSAASHRTNSQMRRASDEYSTIGKPRRGGSQGDWVVSKLKVSLFSIPLLVAGQLVSVGDTQKPQAPTKAVQLAGLIGVKNNTKGSLTVEDGALRFTHSRSISDLSPSSMQDVVTGSDSQRVIRGTLGTLSR